MCGMKLLGMSHCYKNTIMRGMFVILLTSLLLRWFVWVKKIMNFSFHIKYKFILSITDNRFQVYDKICLHLLQFLPLCKSTILLYSCCNDVYFQPIHFALFVWIYLDGWISSSSLSALWCFNDSGRCCCWGMNSLRCDVMIWWEYLPFSSRVNFNVAANRPWAHFVEMMLSFSCWLRLSC